MLFELRHSQEHCMVRGINGRKKSPQLNMLRQDTKAYGLTQVSCRKDGIWVLRVQLIILFQNPSVDTPNETHSLCVLAEIITYAPTPTSKAGAYFWNWLRSNQKSTEEVHYGFSERFCPLHSMLSCQ